MRLRELKLQGAVRQARVQVSLRNFGLPRKGQSPSSPCNQNCCSSWQARLLLAFHSVTRYFSENSPRGLRTIWLIRSDLKEFAAHQEPRQSGSRARASAHLLKQKYPCAVRESSP